jgi:phage tail tube protein FII
MSANEVFEAFQQSVKTAKNYTDNVNVVLQEKDGTTLITTNSKTVGELKQANIFTESGGQLTINYETFKKKGDDPKFKYALAVLYGEKMGNEIKFPAEIKLLTFVNLLDGEKQRKAMG